MQFKMLAYRETNSLCMNCPKLTSAFQFRLLTQAFKFALCSSYPMQKLYLRQLWELKATAIPSAAVLQNVPTALRWNWKALAEITRTFFVLARDKRMLHFDSVYLKDGVFISHREIIWWLSEILARTCLSRLKWKANWLYWFLSH